MRVSDLLVEGRRKDLKYETILKGPKAKQEIDKVLVKLEGKESTGFTKLASKYVELRKAFDDAQTKLENNKGELRGKMEELFDPADELLTRIVETCSLTLQLNKAAQPSSKPETDYEKAFNALVSQLTEMVPELKDRLEEIVKCAVKAATTTKSVPGKTSAFSVKEGAVTDFISAMKDRLVKWFAKYDAKLAKLKAEITRFDKSYDEYKDGRRAFRD